MEDYAHPELLAETEWLAGHLDDPSVRIIDCGMPDAYNRCHVPGAVGLPHPYLKGDQSLFVMPPAQFEELMAARGVSNETTVVLYDDNASLYAARVWWVFDHFGHRNVKVIDGGLNKWLHEGRPLTAQASHPPRAAFHARVDDSRLCTLESLRDCLDDPSTVVWDVRSREEWTGQNDRGNRRRGHVPGAVHLEWRDLMEGPPERKFKPAAVLRQMLAERGITPDKRIVTY